MKQFSGYSEAREKANYKGKAKLPAGAYVCKILGVKLDEEKGYIEIQFDIAEGEQKDFYQADYASQKEDKKYRGNKRIYIPKDDGSEKDQWTSNTFAKWTAALEDSNPGYVWDWDEGKWKNKLIGIVFGETGTRIEGKDIVYTEARYPVDIESIRAGKVKPANFKSKNGYGEENTTSSDDFMNIPDNLEDELPFK